ncbi:unnamed protein product [Acanthoscelides obtectus]|uniref:C2H2-type domain-containing protein n=1 Tax=Acanthoscelides obtectus TaxID=200917 RepID=A0A9P0K2L0_ACAOB|nr:unnamed protein product [Acanthoscelides obtectus]CAK1669694.1 Longitudinals lacking protein, isoforms N/O/W/X/Y [Acanthoscelides obtectus]
MNLAEVFALSFQEKDLLLMELIEGYSCDKCGRKYKGKGSLRRHQKYECQMPPIFKCPYCPKRCKQKSNLKLHGLKCLDANVVV